MDAPSPKNIRVQVKSSHHLGHVACVQGLGQLSEAVIGEILYIHIIPSIACICRYHPRNGDTNPETSKITLGAGAAGGGCDTGTDSPCRECAEEVSNLDDCSLVYQVISCG